MSAVTLSSTGIFESRCRSGSRWRTSLMMLPASQNSHVTSEQLPVQIPVFSSRTEEQELFSYTVFISTVHPWCLERFMLLQQDVTSANVCSTVATFERGIFRTKPDFSFPEGMKMQIIWSSWLTISCFGIKRRNNAFLFFSLLFFLLFWSRRIPKSTVHFRS